MATALPIHRHIDTTDQMDRQLLTLWTTAMRDILSRGVQGVTSIDPTVANMYKYDFYGLLTNMGIPVRFHYPHLLANELANPTEYDGVTVRLTILSLAVLESYHSAFTR